MKKRKFVVMTKQREEAVRLAMTKANVTSFTDLVDILLLHYLTTETK